MTRVRLINGWSAVVSSDRASPTEPATPATPVTAVAAAPVPKQLVTVVVQAEIAYRNRTPDIAPVLSYDLEYFQRFEPNTVGDMVKRLPGAAFVGSDIMEYDGVQLRDRKSTRLNSSH